MKLHKMAAMFLSLFSPGVVGGVIRFGSEGSGRQAPEQTFESISGPNAYPITAALTLTEAVHAGRTGLFDIAAGVTVTLPRAVGSGAIYRFFVKTAVTSVGDKIQVANADDVIQGIISSTLVGTPTTNNGWIAGSTGDTITLNGTTTGGLRGDWIELQDVAAGLFTVRGQTSQSGTGATPFSAAVS